MLNVDTLVLLYLSNAIGLVEGRMLFVSYTMRGDVIRIISARGAEPHEKRRYHEI
jgi:uncharacterized DUF497 family protein